MKKLIIWLTLVSFLSMVTFPSGATGQNDEGKAAGQAANTYARGSVNGPQASANVPGYTATPAESAYYGQSNLAGQANARLAYCATALSDPVCQAQGGGLTQHHGQHHDQHGRRYGDSRPDH